MAIIRNYFDQFINHIKSDEHIKNMKIYGVLEENFEDFYFVCEKFADIGLDAPKYRIPGTCDVQGCFQFEDIRKAKEAAKSFYAEKNITDNRVMLYDKERCICDLVMMKDEVDKQIYVQAIKEYFKAKYDARRLIKYAKLFGIEDKIRDYMDVLT